MKLFPPKIKICGITKQKDAEVASSLGVHYLGFIFYKDSKRYIEPSAAKKIIGHLKIHSSRVKTVGVFVNEDYQSIQDMLQICPVDILQFSGNENPSLCAQFYKPVWKTIHIQTEADLMKVAPFSFLKAIHLDTAKDDHFGGTGESFPFEIAKKAKKIKRKIILSGGLSADNIQDAIHIANPWAVDINSGIEDAPGEKNHQKLQEIVKLIRS